MIPRLVSIGFCVSLMLASLLATEPVEAAKECNRKPSTCFKRYVRDEEFVEATYVYNENQDVFRDPKEKKKRDDELQELADHLHSNLAPRIDASILEIQELRLDPIDVPGWDHIEEALTSSSQILSEYQFNKILEEPEFAIPAITVLETAHSSLLDEVINRRLTAFLAYDHSQDRGFFEAYPIQIVDDEFRTEVVSTAWPQVKPFVLSLERAQVLDLVKVWSSHRPSKFEALFGTDIYYEISDAYYGAMIDDLVTGRETEVGYLGEAVRAATLLKVFPTEGTKSRLLFVLNDPPSQIETSFKLGFAEHFDVLEEVPSEEVLERYDLVFVVSVTDTELSVSTADAYTVDSKYKAGERQDVNPEYIQAQSAYSAAMNNFNIANANYRQASATNSSTPSIASGIAVVAAGVQVGNARESVEAAQARMSRTSPTVLVPIYQDYEFSASIIDIERRVEGRVAMMRPSYAQGRTAPFEKVSKERMKIAVGAHPSDRNASRNYKTPEDLNDVEAGSVSLKLDSLVAELDSVNAVTRDAQGAAAFVSYVAQPKEAAKPTRSQSGAAPPPQLASHPAIGGVAVVGSPVGGVGSGFYVSEYRILTNQHVVDDMGFVQIELYDGRKGTGRVVAEDIDRDLALVETSLAGQPLALFDGTTLPLGESVTAIGHPSGLKFTITKGVISAVREQQSSNSNGLGGRFLFVQTDTAISPGNSGGPLLLGNKVIGINTEKLVDVKVEGIGFALHFTEIARFLALSQQR